MKKIDLYHPEEFTTFEYESAESVMRTLDPQTLSSDDYVFAHIENQVVGSDYQGQCVKQPRFYNSVFNGTNFDGIYGQSSRIINCTFNKSRFKDAGMTMSDFSLSKFCNDSLFNNCGCSKSNFTNTVFNAFVANASVFTECFFIQTKFEFCDFHHCSFENSQFKKCAFENCNLIHTTLEFATFDNVSFKDVTLPFWGVLKSFGLLNEISNQKNICIKYSNKGKEISVPEFLDLLIPIQPYLYKKEEFFALANINIFLGNRDKAFYYILWGLNKGLKERDFRTIRFLCKLASYTIFFHRDDLRKLYNAIITNSYISDMNNHEYQLYLQEAIEIKKLLIDNPFSMPQLTITCHTDFEQENYFVWVEFINFLENTIRKSLPNCYYYFSVRHNSPPTFEIFISDLLPSLYEFCTCFLELCTFSAAALKFVDKLTKVYKEIQSAKSAKVLETAGVEKANLENILMREEIHAKRIENEISQLTLQKLKKELESKEIGSCSDDRTHLSNDIQQQITTIKFEFHCPDEESLPLREYTIDTNQEDNSLCD